MFRYLCSYTDGEEEFETSCTAENMDEAKSAFREDLKDFEILGIVMEGGEEIEDLLEAMEKEESIEFFDLWDGDGDGEELLESGVYYIYNYIRVEFDIVEYDAGDPVRSMVLIKEVKGEA